METLKENKHTMLKSSLAILVGCSLGMLASQLLIKYFANPDTIENIQELNNRIMLLGLFGIILWFCVMGFMIYSIKTSRAWINEVGLGAFIYFTLLMFSVFLVVNWIIPALLG